MMKKYSMVLAFVSLLAFQVDCKKETPPPAGAGATSGTPKKESPDHSKDDGHGHAEEDHDVHDGHDHGNAGKARDLGTLKIGGRDVHVVDEGGGVVAGKTGSFHIKISGGPVKTVRVWVGTESGKESVKMKAEKEGEDFHALPEAPSPLPPGSALWIEIETDAGTTKGSIGI